MTISSAFLEVLLRAASLDQCDYETAFKPVEGSVHVIERAARGEVLENGSEAFDSHCCGMARVCSWDVVALALERCVDVDSAEMDN